MLLFYNKLITSLTIVYDKRIIIIPAHAEVSHVFNIVFASSLHASFVINLNHIHTTNANKTIIIKNHKYLLTSWIYHVIKSDWDSISVGQVSIISLFPSVGGTVKDIADTNEGNNNERIINI